MSKVKLAEKLTSHDKGEDRDDCHDNQYLDEGEAILAIFHTSQLDAPAIFLGRDQLSRGAVVYQSTLTAFCEGTGESASLEENLHDVTPLSVFTNQSQCEALVKLCPTFVCCWMNFS